MTRECRLIGTAGAGAAAAAGEGSDDRCNRSVCSREHTVADGGFDELTRKASQLRQMCSPLDSESDRQLANEGTLYGFARNCYLRRKAAKMFSKPSTMAERSDRPECAISLPANVLKLLLKKKAFRLDLWGNTPSNLTE